MSNPFLTQGTSIPDFSGSDSAIRTFVTSVSFNDDNLKITNSKGLKIADTKGQKSLFVDPITDTESGDSVKKAGEHTPPFITQEIWSKEDKGIMFNGSYSILRNGSLTPVILIPNRPEFLNNFMEWDSANPGESGTSFKNGPWIWKARKITREKLTGTNEYKTTHGDYLKTENFDTNKKETAEQWARSLVIKSTSRIHVPTHPTDTENEGISLELRTKDIFPLKRLDGTQTNIRGPYYSADGTISKGSLGSFMILMSLNLDEKRSGDGINKTPPWDVTISLGEAVDIKNNDKAKNITIQINKGNTVKVSVFGTITEFNLPSSPVATSSQDPGKEDPNMMALTVIPVFNGIQVSVGNYNGLDKKTTSLMSQFCVKNKGLDVTSLYNRQINVDFPENENVDLFDSVLLDLGDTVGPSIIVESTSENESSNGLIEIGDQLLIDLFNVSGNISYVPVFFQTHADASLLFPVETDVDEATNISYTVWPVWCKNGMNAFLQKESVSFVDFEVKDVKANISSYTRIEQPTESFGLSTIILEGINPFSAGDTISITGTSGADNIWIVSSSSGNSVSWQDNRNSNFSEPSSNGKVELVGDRKGTMLRYKFRIKDGQRTNYDAGEDDKIAEIRYNNIVDRFNNSIFSRYPVIMYGAIIVRKELIDLGTIHNNNTPFFNLGNEWKTTITNISVTHSLEGTSGSLVLDRYALTQLYGNNSDFALQQVGQISLAIQMTKSGTDNDGTTKYAFRLGRDEDSSIGNIFRGFGYGFGIDQSSGAHQINIPLVGVNRKLEEMKLINAPFFDGKTIKQTIDFMCAWGNIEPDYTAANTSDKLSASSVLAQVRHEFKTGTSLWNAMQEAGNDTAHYIIAQPDAKIHVIKFDAFGEPDSNFFTPKNWDYPNDRSITLNRSPDFSQFYNKIIVLALQNTAAQAASSDPDKNPLDSNKFGEDFPISPIAVGADLTKTSLPHIPWEKIIIKPLDSFWTEAALASFAQILARQILQIYYTGSLSIPGNLGIHLFDKLNNRYWITGITHNFDVVSKNFTTDLTVSILSSAGDVTFDSNGQPIVRNPSGNIEPYDP